MTPLAAPSPAVSSAPSLDRGKLATAAKQFEAIFVRQMLAAAHKTNFGDTLFSSAAGDTFQQMQDERFADIAAQTGTFGIAKFIEAQLASQLEGKE